MTRFSRDSILLPVVGGVLCLPMALLLAGPMFGSVMKDWPRWISIPVFGIVALLASCLLVVCGIRIAAWRRRKRGGQ